MFEDSNTSSPGFMGQNCVLHFRCPGIDATHEAMEKDHHAFDVSLLDAVTMLIQTGGCCSQGFLCTCQQALSSIAAKKLKSWFHLFPASWHLTLVFNRGKLFILKLCTGGRRLAFVFWTHLSVAVAPFLSLVVEPAPGLLIAKGDTSAVFSSYKTNKT